MKQIPKMIGIVRVRTLFCVASHGCKFCITILCRLLGRNQYLLVLCLIGMTAPALGSSKKSAGTDSVSTCFSAQDIAIASFDVLFSGLSNLFEDRDIKVVSTSLAQFEDTTGIDPSLAADQTTIDGRWLPLTVHIQKRNERRSFTIWLQAENHLASVCAPIAIDDEKILPADIRAIFAH